MTAPIYVVDVETANSARSSVCSVGVVSVHNGIVEDVYDTLVNPEDEFGELQIHLHGIEPATVVGAPTMPEVASRLRGMFDGNVVASHTMFDRQALDQAFARYRLEPLAARHWLDTCRIARAVWPEFGRHGLAALAENLGIALEHHNALQDARAAGQVLAACQRIDPGAAAPPAGSSLGTGSPPPGCSWNNLIEVDTYVKYM